MSRRSGRFTAAPVRCTLLALSIGLLSSTTTGPAAAATTTSEPSATWLFNAATWAALTDCDHEWDFFFDPKFWCPSVTQPNDQPTTPEPTTPQPTTPTPTAPTPTTPTPTTLPVIDVVKTPQPTTPTQTTPTSPATSPRNTATHTRPTPKPARTTQPKRTQPSTATPSASTPGAAKNPGLTKPKVTSGVVRGRLVSPGVTRAVSPMSGEPVASTDLPVMGRAPSPTEPAVTRTSPQPSLESASVAQEQVSASGQRRLRASGRVGFDGLFPAVVGGLSLVVAAGLAWSSRRRVAAE